MKHSKVAQRNETNERIKLFEHSQASRVCLKPDYNTGIFQNWTIKNSSLLDISRRVIFSSNAVEPRFNEPLYNEVLSITNDILQPREIRWQ